MTDTPAMLLQLYIATTACAAIWLLARVDRRRRWGFVVGLLGQPAWVYATWIDGQFGMLAVAGFFTWVYGRGVWLEFVRPRVMWMGDGRL